MSWKNYKKEIHRRRIAKRYVRDWFNYRNEPYLPEVFDHTDKNKEDYIQIRTYYSKLYDETYTYPVVDYRKAWVELSQEEVWGEEKSRLRTQFISAKKLTSGAYDKYRRVSKLSVGKAWFSVHRKYDKHVQYVGKYGTEEEIDNLTPTGDVFTRFGWWW